MSFLHAYPDGGMRLSSAGISRQDDVLAFVDEFQAPYLWKPLFQRLRQAIHLKIIQIFRIREAIGANQKKNVYFEGSGYMVSWCYGHLIEMAQPQDYDEKYGKWTYESLPIIPSEWIYKVKDDTKEQYLVLKQARGGDGGKCL